MLAVLAATGLGFAGPGAAQMYAPPLASEPISQDSYHYVAIERCDAVAGSRKDDCVRQAEAEFVAANVDTDADPAAALTRRQALAEADARNPGFADKHEAEYRVVIEQCDERGGFAMDSCVKNAKARYGRP
jgi:hypothetical protein